MNGIKIAVTAIVILLILGGGFLYLNQDKEGSNINDVTVPSSDDDLPEELPVEPTSGDDDGDENTDKLPSEPAPQGVNESEGVDELPVETASEQDEATENVVEEQTEEPVEEPAPEPVSTNDYQNGSYLISGSYRVPNGIVHDMRAEFTLENDIITDVTLSFDGTQGGSTGNQMRFVSDLQITGQDVDALALSRVGGASLTTNEFNNMLVDLREEAAISS